MNRFGCRNLVSRSVDLIIAIDHPACEQITGRCGHAAFGQANRVVGSDCVNRRCRLHTLFACIKREYHLPGGLQGQRAGDSQAVYRFAIAVNKAGEGKAVVLKTHGFGRFERVEFVPFGVIRMGSPAAVKVAGVGNGKVFLCFKGTLAGNIACFICGCSIEFSVVQRCIRGCTHAHAGAQKLSAAADGNGILFCGSGSYAHPALITIAAHGENIAARSSNGSVYAVAARVLIRGQRC